MHKLIIEDDEGKTTVVPLIRDEITIGRKEGNTIRLTERNVSRRHAKLLRQNGAIFIEDLNSYNGIKVNGNKISGRVAVAEGDRIQIGDYVLGLKVEGQQLVASKEGGGDLPVAKADAETAQIDVSDVSAAAAEADTREAEQQAHGRLVCVSTNFAGLEFTLSKSSMVIGRTDDNDVVVNHRSISRHHARIVEEHGRHTIIDLQSANGVRVNGEEYGKVELRKGDLIDLGHVRLRFVAPGEDFVFARDATVVDPSKLAGSSRGGLWIALAVVAVAIVAYFVYRAAQPGETHLPDAQATGAVEQPGPGSTTGPDPQQLIVSLKKAIEGERWELAKKHCAKLRKLGSADNHVLAQCTKAEEEKKARELFEEGTKAEGLNRHKQALEAFNRIPAGSVYRQKLKSNSSYTKAVDAYRTLVRDDLNTMVDKGLCEDAKKKKDEAKRLLGDAVRLDAAYKRVDECREAVAVVTPQPKVRRPIRRHGHKRNGRRHKKPPRVDPAKAAAKAAARKAKAEKAAAEAWRAYIKAQHGRAFNLARKAIQLGKRGPREWAVYGASACQLGKAGAARKAYSRLSSGRKQLLRDVCSRKGITVP